MKLPAFILVLLLFIGCNGNKDNSSGLQVQIDSLQNKLNNSYKPGLGEFMSNIQVHHAKLWFAGINSNWKLADFEINEIRETLDDIQKFSVDRPEVKSIKMIDPAIDSVSHAIKRQDSHLFKRSFGVLTTTCNHCHNATDHGFNVIIIPTVPPFSNQQFKPVR